MTLYESVVSIRNNPPANLADSESLRIFKENNALIQSGLLIKRDYGLPLVDSAGIQTEDWRRTLSTLRCVNE